MMSSGPTFVQMSTPPTPIIWDRWSSTSMSKLAIGTTKGAYAAAAWLYGTTSHLHGPPGCLYGAPRDFYGWISTDLAISSSTTRWSDAVILSLFSLLIDRGHYYQVVLLHFFSYRLSLETMLSARFGDGLVDKYFAYLVMLTIVDLLDRFEILCFGLYV